MFEIEVTNNRASTKRGELLTKGQVGAQVQFTFNDHWTGMKKTAVFKRCGKTIDVMDNEWNGDIVTVPPEMTEAAGLLVHVGVYGVSEDGKRITPTLYAPLGAVALGAEPDGDPSTDPTLPVWAQIQGDIDNIKDELEDVSAKAVQSDWNQNDPIQPDYIKNRIAYDSRSDEYDGETITLILHQGEYLTSDKAIKYLGAIDDQIVSYTAVLTGKNQWNKTYTVEYESVWIGCDIAPEWKIYSSIAIDPRFNNATSKTPWFIHMDTATEEVWPAGLYLSALDLPWNTEYGDMTLTVHPRFAKTGELKPIDKKYLGPPAPFNWEYDLDAEDAQNFRDKIGASDFSGEFDDLHFRPLNALANDEAPTVSASYSGPVTVTYTSDNLSRPSQLPIGQIISFRMPTRINSSAVMQVKVVIKSRSGYTKEYGPYQVVRRFSGINETILQQAASLSGYAADEPVVLVWTGSHFMDISASYVYGGDAFYKPVEVSKGGVPTGGARGSVLTKFNDNDYLCTWKNVFPDAPKQGQILVAKNDVTGNPFSSDLSWQDPAVVASDVVVIKATLASLQDTTFLIDYSPKMIRDLIYAGKFVALVQNDNNDTNTYTYQYIFGNMYSNPSTAQGGGYGWSMPYSNGGDMVVKRIGYIGMENGKYKWEIKTFKIPLEEVTT